MFKNRQSIRLQDYDYASAGYYFVTICVQGRECLFGEIINGQMFLNKYGEIVKFTWFDLMNHSVNLALDCFIIMPNHVHGIVIINNLSVGAGSKPALKLDPINRAGLEPAPTIKLSEIVRQFKTFSAQRINQLRNTPGLKFWQRNYYEHIIRNDAELNKIRRYIENNPFTWESDENNI